MWNARSTRSAMPKTTATPVCHVALTSFRTGSASTLSALSGVGDYATWNDRFAKPIWKSSITTVGGAEGSVAAPNVTKIGV